MVSLSLWLFKLPNPARASFQSKENTDPQPALTLELFLPPLRLSSAPFLIFEFSEERPSSIMPSRVAFSDNCRISCLGLPTANSDLEDDDGELTCLSNYSYHKLPAHLLKLSILKLDGSVFDVVIEKNSSVGELKHAIEDVFSSSPYEGQGEISWSHVWGHFCLLFGDQKLLNDRTYIMNIGIKDGDQLQFVHHLSVNYSPKKRRAKNPNGLPIQRARSSDTSGGDEEELFDNEEMMIEATEFRLSNMVRGWLPSRRRGRPSRFGMQRLGGREGL